jgi:hypothetical protein
MIPSTTTNDHLDRRAFLLGLPASVVVAGTAAADPGRARQPNPPYRVWFQPRQFHRDMDLYAHMTLDASGWLGTSPHGPTAGSST